MEGQRRLDEGLCNDLYLFTMQDYESLRYSNDRAVKDAFISGDLEEPGLRYGDVDMVGIEDRLEDLESLQQVVHALGNDLVVRAYQPKILELRHKYALLDAAGKGDDTGVRTASIALYGAPRPEFYAYAIRDLRARLDRVEAGYPGVDRVAEAVELLRPHALDGEMPRFDFDAISLPGIREYETSVTLRAQDIRVACEEAFRTYGLTEWKAVIDAPGERITFNTDQTLRTVFIPSDEDIALRKYPLTRERVRALVAHEIATHALRRENGAQSPLGLLGVGLAGYLRAEEGIATYREQLEGGARHFAGTFGYLAVSWAYGLDGTPRSFRQLFTLLVPYLFVSYLEHALSYDEPVDLVELERRVVRNAWARCVRVYRGTTGATPGCCFTKDIVYLEGNIAIWQLVTKGPSWERHFDLGKYDPTNEEHVAILRDLGML